MLRNKKLWGFLIALVMAVSMFGTASWAADVQIPNSAYLVGPTAAFETITVNFIIEAGNEYWSSDGAFYDDFEITLTSATGPKVWTVSDLLAAVDAQSTTYTFYTKTGPSATPFVPTSDYLYGVNHAGTLFQPGDFDLWGWSFRVNDMYPLISDDPELIGASVLETPIKDGFTVHFVWEYPFIEYGDNFASEFVRISPTQTGPSGIGVRLEEFRGYFDNNFSLVIENYSTVTKPTAVSLYAADGITILATGMTNTSGEIMFSLPLASGTYYVKSESLPFNDGTEYDGYFLEQASGYVKIEF